MRLLAGGVVATPAHRERGDVVSEAQVVAERRLDDPVRMERLTRHLREQGYPDDQGLSATMMVVRDLRSPAVRRANALWWDGIVRFSRRDQLTFNYALWLAGLRWEEVAVDYREPNRLFSRRPHRAPNGRILTPTDPVSSPARCSAWLTLRRTAGANADPTIPWPP